MTAWCGADRRHRQLGRAGDGFEGGQQILTAPQHRAPDLLAAGQFLQRPNDGGKGGFQGAAKFRPARLGGDQLPQWKAAPAGREEVEEKGGLGGQGPDGLHHPGPVPFPQPGLGHSFQVANQVDDLVMAEGQPEMPGGDVFQVMGLVKNHRLITGQHFGMAEAAHGQIGKKEVMVDDQQLGPGRPLPQTGDEAVGAVGAG